MCIRDSLWAHDLSTYDAIVSWNTYIPIITPYFGNHISLFCLLMTVTNIIYTKFNMDQTNTGQQQMPGMKAMMYMMPLMMLVFFNQYASGLTYYYFISTLITILQTVIFRYTINEDKLLAKLEENKKKLKQLEAEYASIRERLEIACQMGDLNRYAKAAILDMSRKVIEHLAVKYKNVAKGVSRTMGGKVLNYEAKDILNRGRREGEEYTKIQIATKLLNMGNDIKSVAELAELPQETVEKLAQSISKEEK